MAETILQITTAFVNQYHANVERALQQRGSILRPCVRNESQKGEYQYFEKVGSVEATEIVDKRHGDSPFTETPHARRRVGISFYDVGDFIDKEDKVRMLIDPTSSYVQNFVDALGRKMDDVIIAAAKGTAYTGKDGATSTTFDSNMTIAVDFASTGTASNLTIKKLIEAKRLLLSKFNQPGAEPWYCVITSNQLAALLNTTQVTSVDYNSVKALVMGDVNTFMGFQFIICEKLAKATNNRSVLCFPKSGILLSTAMDVETYVERRADKRFNWYAYARAGFGAVRMDEAKIVEILCDETK